MHLNRFSTGLIQKCRCLDFKLSLVKSVKGNFEINRSITMRFLQENYFQNNTNFRAGPESQNEFAEMALYWSTKNCKWYFTIGLAP